MYGVLDTAFDGHDFEGHGKFPCHGSQLIAAVAANPVAVQPVDTICEDLQSAAAVDLCSELLTRQAFSEIEIGQG